MFTIKIAVIGDIHANKIALDLALNDIQKEKVDKILFLGDYITDGEESNTIIEMVRKYGNYVILGNREEYILNYQPEKKEYNNYKPISYVYKSLTKDNIKYLRTLPDHKIIKLNNYRILMIHGDKYLNNNQDLIMTFDELIKDYNFDICFFAHSHQYSYTGYKDKIFINPGSIGQPVDSPSYKYCIVDLNEKVDIKLKKFAVKNTFKELEKTYKSTRYYEENRIWGHLVLKGIKNGKDYCTPFIKKINAKVEDASKIDSDIFNRIWDEVSNKRNK